MVVKKGLLLAASFMMANLLLAQTEKGSHALIFHSFCPVGIQIDGLPVNLFPQSSGLGFSYNVHKVKSSGIKLEQKERVFTIGMGLSVHEFLFDNFSWGITGNIFYGNTNYTGDEIPKENYSTTMILAGPEFRYYINAGEKLKFNLKASPTLGTILSTYNGKELHAPKRLYQFSGALGTSYFINPSFSIDLSVTYNIFTIRNKGSYSYASRKEYIDGIGTDIGFTFFF